MPAADLDDHERTTLARLLAAVLPSTSGAGAAAAGAVEYVLRRLEGPEAGALDELRTVLASARGREEAELARLSNSGDPWFGRLRTWAWEGYLCDPALGGNRDGVGWRRFEARPHRRISPLGGAQESGEREGGARDADAELRPGSSAWRASTDSEGGSGDHAS